MLKRRISTITIRCAGALASLLALTACGGDESGGGGSTPEPKTYELSGHAQKGPLVNGSTVRVAELDAALAPTGRTFDTSIEDDAGTFALPNVALTSPYVQLSADGFYFDEVRGELSSSRVVLSALADVTGATEINTNILSHLERPRVEHLIAQGQSFADAKAQAQAEILSVFAVQLPAAGPSETLNIANGSDADAALLAVSVIVQGLRTPGELSELISNMGNDLQADGTLDDPANGSALINGAVYLDTAAVRQNLEQRYADLGVAATIGDFESHVQHFIDTTPFTVTANIEYPAMGAGGPNVLDPAATTFGQGSMAATLPRGASLKIFMKRVGGSSDWGFNPSTKDCWDVTTFDIDLAEQTFTIAATDVDRTCDMREFMVFSGAVVQVDYFENGAMTPTFTKTVDGTFQ